MKARSCRIGGRWISREKGEATASHDPRQKGEKILIKRINTRIWRVKGLYKA